MDLVLLRGGSQKTISLQLNDGTGHFANANKPRIEPSDFDVATSATPEEGARLFPEAVTVGAQS